VTAAEKESLKIQDNKAPVAMVPGQYLQQFRQLQ
jgi:hypothetical protein